MSVKNKPIAGYSAYDTNEGEAISRLHSVDTWLEPGEFVTILDGHATLATAADKINGVVGHEYLDKQSKQQQIFIGGEVWAKNSSDTNTNPKSIADNRGSTTGLLYDKVTEATIYLEKLG